MFLITKNQRINNLYYKTTYNRMLYVYSKKNVTIGENSIFYNVNISSSSKGDKFVIGKNCCLTGCTLIGHDASPATFLAELVIKNKVYLPGSRRPYRQKITIGDNVFIGVNAVILPGITIGNNVVIGAGSIVTKNINDNSVVVGNPARVISSIEEYKLKYRNVFKQNPENF